MKEAESLKEYEPHIVRSKFLPTSSSVASPAGTSRRGRARWCSTAPVAGPRRRDAHRRKRRQTPHRKAPGRGGRGARAAEEAKRVAAAEKRAAAAVAAEAKRAARQAAKAAEDPKLVAERERIRVNGGFSQEMGCWIPPAHVIYSDSELEDDDQEDEESVLDRRMTRKVPSLSRIGGGRGRFGVGDGFEEDDVLMPTVRAPNFAKIMARVKSSAKRGWSVCGAPEGRRGDFEGRESASPLRG